jgi:hypothetical protein
LDDIPIGWYYLEGQGYKGYAATAKMILKASENQKLAPKN